MRSHQVVLAAGELFDLPDEARLLGRIMDASGRRLIVPGGRTLGSAQCRFGRRPSRVTHPELGRVGVVRHRHVDLDIIGRAPPLELRPHLDDVLDPRTAVILNRRCRREGMLCQRAPGQRGFQNAPRRDSPSTQTSGLTGVLNR